MDHSRIVKVVDAELYELIKHYNTEHAPKAEAAAAKETELYDQITALQKEYEEHQESVIKPLLEEGQELRTRMNEKVQHVDVELGEFEIISSVEQADVLDTAIEGEVAVKITDELAAHTELMKEKIKAKKEAMQK